MKRLRNKYVLLKNINTGEVYWTGNKLKSKFPGCKVIAKGNTRQEMMQLWRKHNK